MGLPVPSARRWPLVLKPPWLRPSASVAGSPFCSRSVLVGTNERGIGMMGFPVQGAGRVSRFLDRGEEAVPEPGRLPAVEACGHAGGRLITGRQVGPRRARPEKPQDAVEDRLSVV